MPSAYHRWKLRLHAHWEEFAAAPVGERFVQHYHRQQQDDARKSKLALVARAGLAVVLVVVGVVLLFIPGPGLLFIGLGAAMCASHSLLIARGMDRCDVVLRRYWAQAQGYWAQMRAKFKRAKRRFSE